MPPVPPELETLDSLLHQGLEELLREAQRLDVLEPPFGRPPLQLPLEEYQAAEMEDSEDDDDEEDEAAEAPADEEAPAGPVFQYDYGFNPLMFLAKFLSKNNPKNIAAREMEYQRSSRYLIERAQFAMVQARTYGSIQEKVVQMRSGVSHGPVAGNITFSSATLWARAFKPCKLVFEVAATDAFDNILEIEAVDATEATNMCGRIPLNMLHSGFTYHYRVSALNPSEGLLGPNGGYFITGRFSTFPDTEETRPVKFCFAPPPSIKLAASFLDATASKEEEAPDMSAAMASLEPTCLLLLGGMLPRHSPGIQLHKLSPEQTRELQLSQMRDARMRQLLSSSGCLVAWSDDTKGASAALQTEEQAVQRAEREKRKRRNPRQESGDPRGDIGQALASMEACWPITIEDKVTRHTYNSQRCGTLAELFLVDTRGGSIGKSQAEWLEEMVPGSPCLWKIIVTSAPLSVSEPKETAAAGAGVFTGSDPELDAAAAKIQSRQRGRLARREKAVDTTDDKSKDSNSTARRGDDKGHAKASLHVAVAPPPAEDESSKTPTLYDLAASFQTDLRVPNVVFVSGSSVPFAVSYEGNSADPKKSMRVLEFGAAPLGHGKVKKATWCESLRPSHLLPAWTEGDVDVRSTFGSIAITEHGELQFSVHNAEAVKLHSTVCHPSKRR